MGRRPIPLDQPVAEKKVRPTFTKRKEGLQRKAQQLGTMCGCRVALVIIPPDGCNNDEMIEVATHGTIREIFQMYLRRQQDQPVMDLRNQSPSEAILNGIGEPHMYPTNQVQQLYSGVPHVYPASQSQGQQQHLGVSHLHPASQSLAQQQHSAVSHISQQHHFEVPESSHAGQSRAQQQDIGAIDDSKALEVELPAAGPNQPQQSGDGVMNASDSMHQSNMMHRMWGYHQNQPHHRMHQIGNHMSMQPPNHVPMEHAQMHPHPEGHYTHPLVAQPGDELHPSLAGRRPRHPIPHPVAQPGASAARCCRPRPGPNMRRGSA